MQGLKGDKGSKGNKVEDSKILIFLINFKGTRGIIGEKGDRGPRGSQGISGRTGKPVKLLFLSKNFNLNCHREEKVQREILVIKVKRVRKDFKEELENQLAAQFNLLVIL